MILECTLLLIGDAAALNSITHLGCQNIVPNVIQRRLDRPQPLYHVAGTPKRHKCRFRRTGSDGTNSSLASKISVVVAHTPRVKPPVYQHPVKPAFEYRRLGMPPKGKLEDHKICPFQPGNFPLYILGQ